MSDKSQWIGFGWISRVGQLVYGILYPTWQSLKALKSVEAEDDSQWLTYWAIFGILLIVERLFQVIVYYLPMYYEMKIVLLFWLAQKNGAKQVYEKYVAKAFPIIEQFVEDSDYRMNKLKEWKTLATTKFNSLKTKFDEKSKPSTEQTDKKE
ncbi:TB2/DP1 [Hexamita inflata]|uniref:HVA22 family protein n=1 Tax=Hexamita inflata TaxID=28002 RepID=A0AA86P5T6_9EUKA|nr:HVA22 family protein [Hexamita inflata]CAI9967754.1 HVA22 family protein [Hexamita inflata]